MEDSSKSLTVYIEQLSMLSKLFETHCQGKWRNEKTNNVLKKMTNHVIVTNGPRIELFFPPCKIIDLRMILYLRMILQLNRLNNYAIDTS